MTHDNVVQWVLCQVIVDIYSATYYSQIFMYAKTHVRRYRPHQKNNEVYFLYHLTTYIKSVTGYHFAGPT